MLFFIGVPVVTLEEKEGVFVPEAGGYSFSLAIKVREQFPEVGYFASLSSDIVGRTIINSLVKNQLFFDPDLIEANERSFIRFKEGDEVNDYGFFSSPVLLSEEKLVASLESNSDVKAVHLSAEGLFYQPLFSASLSAVSFHTPKPVIIIDPASSSFDSSKDIVRYKRQLREAFENASLLLLEKEDLEVAEMEEAEVKVPYVIFENEYTRFSDGFVCKGVSKAKLLAIMLEKECFGSVSEDPAFKGFDKIKDILA